MPQQGMDWKQALTAFGPMLAAGFAGQGPGMGAFGENYARGAAVADELRMRQQAIQQREQEQQWAQEMDRIEVARRAEADRMQKQEMVTRLFADMPNWADRATQEALDAGALDVPGFARERYGETIKQILALVPDAAPHEQLLMAAPGDWQARSQSAEVRRLKPAYDRFTAGRTDEELAGFFNDPTPKDYFNGRSFPQVHALMAAAGQAAVPQAAKQGAPQLVETIENGRRVKKAVVVRPGDVFPVPEPQSAETGNWDDSKRVDANGRAIYVNSRTGATRTMAFGQAPIPKSAAQEAEDVRKKNAVIEQADLTLAEIDNLLDANGKLRPEALGAVGASRYNQLWRIQGNPAFAANASIDRIRARMVTDLMAKMKAQSRTGATGFGQLTEKELKLLQDAAAKLNPGLPEQVFEKELQRIRRDLERMVMEPTGSTPTAQTAVPSAVSDLLKGKGDGRYTLTDGSVWIVEGGTVRKGN